MTQDQVNAMKAIIDWQNSCKQGSNEWQRAMIAGTMVQTALPLTDDQLSHIDEIINY